MTLQYLRIKGHPQINDFDFVDLAPVNVIAGKNNSGKTTLLTALCKKDFVHPGIRLEDSHFEKLTEMAVDRYPELKQHRHWRNQFKAVVEESAENRGILWKNEITGFVQSVIETFRRQVGARVAWINEPLVDAVMGLFLDVGGILLPPTRRMESSAEIDTGEGEQPTGPGILNRLSFLKNRPTDSNEKRRFLSLGKTFLELSEGFSFDVVMEKNNTIRLLFSPNSRDWVPADQCGLGLSDLLVILFFVERPGGSFIAIEEPETHIHPAMQRRLLAYLSRVEDRIFFISTHSNVFLDPTFVGKVVTTSFNERVCPVDSTNKAFVLADLGYAVADNLVSDYLILCEGPSDVPVLAEFLTQMGVFDRFNIKLLPLGGDIMDQIDLSVFAERSRVRALVDKDQ